MNNCVVLQDDARSLLYFKDIAHIKRESIIGGTKSLEILVFLKTGIVVDHCLLNVLGNRGKGRFKGPFIKAAASVTGMRIVGGSAKCSFVTLAIKSIGARCYKRDAYGFVGMSESSSVIIMMILLESLRQTISQSSIFSHPGSMLPFPSRAMRIASRPASCP